MQWNAYRCIAVVRRLAARGSQRVLFHPAGLIAGLLASVPATRRQRHLRALHVHTLKIAEAARRV